MSFDLRRYSRQTTFRLILGGLLIVFIVGTILIYLIYGPGAALTGIICFGAGIGIILLILIIFWVMGLIVKRSNNE